MLKLFNFYTKLNNAYIDSMATGVTDDGLTGATAKSIRNVSYDSVKTSGKDVVHNE